MTEVPKETLEWIMLLFALSIGINIYFFTIKPFTKLMNWIDNKALKTKGEDGKREE